MAAHNPSLRKPDLRSLLEPALSAGHWTDTGAWHWWDDCYGTGPCRDGYTTAEEILQAKGYGVVKIEDVHQTPETCRAALAEANLL